MNASDDAIALAAAYRGGGLIASLASPPADVAAAYDIQDRVRAELGMPIAGWKLAVTTPMAQAAQGLDAPTVAPLLSGMIVPHGTVFGARRFYKPEAEAEIAIELEEPIDGPVTAETVRARAKGFRLAIEMADTRYVDKPAMGPAGVIADMNSSAALVIGRLESLDQLNAAVTAPVRLRLGDGTIVENLPQEGRPDPLAVVAFLSGFAAERGHMLPAGTLITTGTHTRPTLSGPGAVAATFKGIGEVECQLSEPWS